jgi:hypothetical protein
MTLSAQTGNLRGQVTDESGAVVPGARVVLGGSGVKNQTVTTDGSGAYSFKLLTPGEYLLSGAAQQMATARALAITIHAGEQSFDVQLQLLERKDQVSVDASTAPSVNTESSENASAIVISGQDLDALSDNPDDLAADLQGLAGPSAGPNGGAIFVDGFSGGEIPPKDAIREIRVNRDPFASEYDKLGYGRIEILTKPGADRWRGTVDYNYANSIWNSRNPYADTKAPLLLNEIEGGGGGPLSKRASFTLDGQRNMVDNGYVVNGITVDPRTFAIQPLDQVYKTPQRFTRLSPRLDYQLSPNHTLSARYSFTEGDINGAGIGGFDSVERGYHTQYTHHTAQITETAVIGSAVNETRFQYFRDANQQTPFTPGTAIQLLGALNGGGSPLGHTHDTQNSFELQNYTSILRGLHTWKFGVRVRDLHDDNFSPSNFNGTFSFAGGLAPLLDSSNQLVPGQSALIDSVERYRRTLLFESLGYSAAQIRAAGGGATQFTIASGTPGLSRSQMDAGLFADDTWRIRPNLTIAYGLRYEWQTNLNDHGNFAPRLSAAWALGRGPRRKTVLRAGFGVFYDRFVLANTLTADRYDGVVQKEFALSNPDSYPLAPSLAGLGEQSGTIVERLASDLRATYLLQSAVTLEHQVSKGVTAAFTYTNSRGLHLLRTRDINAPLPGTYDPNVPGSGTYPLGQSSPVFLIESSGRYNQNQLIGNVNAKLNSSFSMFAFYAFNHASSDTDGVSTSPANPYSYAGEYGRASTDVRHRVTVGGSVNLRWNIRVSPFVILQSGVPFNITTGADTYGTTLFNARPGIATNSAKPGVIQTKYGLLDPNPTLGQTLIARNAGSGPAQMTVNLRLAKTIGFGPERGGSSGGAPTASAATANASLPTGGSLRSLIGSPSAPRRYNLILSLSARNVLNHNNPGPIVGNITSPLFGSSNQVAAGINGEGFSENASNRRLEVQIRLTF